MTYTHTGYRPHVGYQHCGSRLWGHTIPKEGQTHALNGAGSGAYRALCGAMVYPQHPYNEWGEPIPSNVLPAGAMPVTCKRCLRLAQKEE